MKAAKCIESCMMKAAAVAVLLLLLCVLPQHEPPKTVSITHDPIICVIDTGEDMYSSSGLKAGFNYEMFHRYSGMVNKSVKIVAAKDGGRYLDSLAAGVIDIVAVPAADTLRHPDVIRSRNIDSHSVWCVRNDEIDIIKEINSWLGYISGTKEYSELINRFYTSYNPHKRVSRGITSKRISPYDNLIRKYAGTLGWDWRMLAAVIYQESRFAINTMSSRGASGLMQVMPQTAEYYSIDNLLDPEENIKTGTKHLSRLQNLYSDFEASERVKFTLATYNAGEGRISDCRNYAASKNLDNTKWDEVVTVIPDMRSSEILKEETVKLGKFRGSETIDYVNNVMSLYDDFCTICPEP